MTTPTPAARPEVRPPAAQFRRRLIAGEPLIGTFIKTPTSHSTEIMGDLGFDFVVIDQEHAPFDRVATDQVLLGARASGTAGLVRVPSAAPEAILGALDDGATGVLVPHVSSVQRARDFVAACRYRGGKRGFSNSPRAGRYGGLGMWPHVDEQDALVTVVAMIEDPEALEVIDAIAAVEGLDAFFIGRGDLTVAMGAAKADAPEVRAAVERIARAGRAAGKGVCAMVGSMAEAGWMQELGVTAFIVSTDQGFMRQAAAKALADFQQQKA